MKGRDAAESVPPFMVFAKLFDTKKRKFYCAVFSSVSSLPESSTG